MKGFANRHNLSRHKKTCQAQPFHEIGCKRSRDDDETRTLSTNPKLQALADAIINDTPVKDKLPAVGEKKLPTPPPEIVDAVFRKLPKEVLKNVV